MMAQSGVLSALDFGCRPGSVATSSIGRCVAESPMRVKGEFRRLVRMLAHELFETFDRKREMRTALVADDRVNFVDNQRARRFQHPPPAFAGQQDVKRFRSRDDDVRRTLRHRGAFGGGRVAGAHERADVDFGQAQRFQFCLNSFERNLQISLNVVAEGFQR